jgi:hypothetical protein
VPWVRECLALLVPIGVVGWTPRCEVIPRMI